MQKRYIIIQSDDTRIDPLYYAWMDRASIDVKWTDNLSRATTFATSELAERTRDDLIKLMHSKRVYDCNIEVAVHPKDKLAESSQPTAQSMSAEQPAEICITDWGEPRRVHKDAEGNTLFALYMHKSKGGLIYAFAKEGEQPKVVSEDGEAVTKAYYVACCNAEIERIKSIFKELCNKDVEKIRAFGGKK